MQQPPVVVDVVRQPPVAPEITMGDVLLGAVGLTGVIMLCALLAGAVVGGIFIWLKRKRDEAAAPTDPGPSRLRS